MLKYLNKILLELFDIGVDGEAGNVNSDIRGKRMTLAFRRDERRWCSRCGAGLDDPASEERGVGPICAKKDTALFARGIAANYGGAVAVVLGMKEELLPEGCQERFGKLREAILGAAEKATNMNDGGLHIAGVDLRKIIREIDWILSHKSDAQTRNSLVKLVRFLGYKELAAVLTHEASTTPANVWFQDGKLFLKGKRNKAGFYGMKAVPGIILPGRNTPENPYAGVAAHAEQFLEVVQNFWPLYQVTDSNGEKLPGGELGVLLQLAQDWVKDHPGAEVSTSAQTEANKPLVLLEMVQLNRSRNWFRVQLSWQVGKDPEMRAIIAAFKEIPYQERTYDPGQRAWFFSPAHEGKLTEILSTLFRVETKK